MPDDSCVLQAEPFAFGELVGTERQYFGVRGWLEVEVSWIMGCVVLWWWCHPLRLRWCFVPRGGMRHLGVPASRGAACHDGVVVVSLFLGKSRSKGERDTETDLSTKEGMTVRPALFPH